MPDDVGRRSDDPGRDADEARQDPGGTTDATPDDADRGTEDSAPADDSTSGAPTSDASAATGSERTARSGPDSGGRPEVVVPMDLYKTVTVFSTLFSIALVVGGMIALDAATARATADAAEVNLPLAFLGVASIVLGAATYAFASRFRAEGMGNPKDTDDEG